MTKLKLNLGCGHDILRGWVNVDSEEIPGVGLVADLDEGLDTFLPYEDNTVDEFRLSHVLEHITHTLPLMAELWRIAKPEAQMTIRVPYGSSNDATEDPTHVRQYFAGSFAYFAQPTYWRADYGYRGDWSVENITLVLDEERYGKASRVQILGEVMGYRNVVNEMVVELNAIKPARPPNKDFKSPSEVTILLVNPTTGSMRVKDD